MRRPEAAWFDIDNTLIDHDNRPSAEMCRALAKIGRWGINTQRSIGQAEKVIFPSEVSLPSIVLSGGEIWEAGKAPIKSFPIPKEARRGVADLILRENETVKLARFYPKGERGIVLFVSTDELEKKFVELYRASNSLGQVVRSIEEFATLLVNTETAMVTIRTKEKGMIRLPSDLKRDIEVDTSAKTDYVITAKGVRKATTLLWLCDYLKLDPQNVLTAGDNEAVDAEVFRHTYGISVSEVPLPNAQRQVKTVEELARLLDQIFS